MSLSNRLRRLEQRLGPPPPPILDRLLPKALAMACYREEIEKLRSLRDAQQSFRLIDVQISANFEERFTLSLESAAMYLTGKSLPQLLREEGEDLDPDFDQEYEMSLEEVSLKVTGRSFAEWRPELGLGRYKLFG